MVTPDRTPEALHRLGTRLDADSLALSRLDAYYAGTQPAAFLSAKSREALGPALTSLSVNWCRLAVRSLAERLDVTGFRTDGPDSAPDVDLWRVWRRNGLPELSAVAHTEALVLGRAFAVVWAGEDPRTPRVTVESARQVAVERDPASREVTAAVKRWQAQGRAYATLYERDSITRYVSASAVVEGAGIPVDGWTVREQVDNPLGIVPVVPLVNRGRLLDTAGVSEMTDVLTLADAINKLTADAMVTSEFYARPRRWATGLEVQEDEAGEPVNPFGDSPDRVWQAEDSDVRFGQFPTATLSGYSELVATLTQQVGAMAALPPHVLGLHGDQPASADAIRSSEAGLVQRARERQQTFGAGWADAARLVLAVRDGTDPAVLDVETVWADPETRTPAQDADAAAKLHGIGVPLGALLTDTLGYSPAQVQRVREALTDPTLTPRTETAA